MACGSNKYGQLGVLEGKVAGPNEGESSESENEAADPQIMA